MEHYLNEYTDNLMKMRKSLMRTVRIDHEEVCILVVSDLIAKRNACKDERQKAFDTVLRWYIDDDEFDRFVVKGEKVK